MSRMTDEALKETRCWSTLNGDRCSLEGNHDLHQSATGNCWLDLDLMRKEVPSFGITGEACARIKALISELTTARAELANVESVMGVQREHDRAEIASLKAELAKQRSGLTR